MSTTLHGTNAHDQIRDGLAALSGECSDCRRCPHGATRKQAVFSKGDPLSALAFVGVAPGADEDEQGLPFVGGAGRYLDCMIVAMRGYARAQGVAFPEDPYFCNVLKCRPPGNKAARRSFRRRRLRAVALEAAGAPAKPPRRRLRRQDRVHGIYRRQRWQRPDALADDYGLASPARACRAGWLAASELRLAARRRARISSLSPELPHAQPARREAAPRSLG